MSSPHRIEINRANSLHSTGPKTEAGKRRSSMNAMKHGFTGQLVVMPDEDLELDQHHLKSFEDEYHPQGATEENLVQALADVSWDDTFARAREQLKLFEGIQPADPPAAFIGTLRGYQREGLGWLVDATMSPRWFSSTRWNFSGRS